jgi:voltage-gated potassium channel
MKYTQGALSSAGYQFFMLVLSIYAVFAIGIQTVMKLDPEVGDLLDYADNGICALFFLDFAISLWKAPNRWKYFVTWGWLDLLSSIPMLDVARWGRVARVIRVIRVLRGLRATKVLTGTILRHRAENGLLAAALAALLLIIFCSAAILQFETDPESNIKTAEDALWWAFTTVTTVGYGDRFPVTGEGRFVATILMFAGVGLFGTFSGFLAAWFLQPEEDADQSELAKLREEIVALRQAVAKLTDQRS